MARQRRRTEESFQMAPMIDMVFLLLVFFMTVSTIAKDSRPELELASSSTAKVPEAAPPRDIITVREKDDGYTYFWSSREIGLDQLPSLLDPAGSSKVVVRAAENLPWKTCNEILQICRQGGVEEIIFATFEE